MSSVSQSAPIFSAAANALPEVTRSGLVAVLVLVVTASFFLFRHRLPSAKTVIFSALYYLYAETRLGQVIHNRQLESRRKKGLGPHSLVSEEDVHVSRGGDFSILPVPFLSDNYAYIVVCERTGCTAFVDPADPDAVLHAFFKYKSDREATYERRRKELEERSELFGAWSLVCTAPCHRNPHPHPHHPTLTSPPVTTLTGTVWDRAFAKPSPPKELELTAILVTHKHMDHAVGSI